MPQLSTHLVFFAFLLVFAFGPGHAFAGEPLELDGSETKVALGLQMECFEDQTALLGLDQVLTPELSSQFFSSEQKIPNFGIGLESAYWCSFSLRNTSNESISSLLEIAYPVLDDIQFFFLHSSGQRSHFHMGDLLPFEHREVLYRNFVVPVKIAQSDSIRILIRIKTTGSMRFPVNLYAPTAFIEQASTHQVIQGLYFGLLLVMALYNLVVFLSLRDKVYLFYTLFVLGAAVFQSGMQGLSFQYLWPETPWFGQKSLLISLAVSQAAGFYFSIAFLELRENAARHYLCLKSLAIIAAGLGLLSLVLSYAIAVRGLTLVALGSAPVLLSAGILRIRQGNIEARYYVLAWASFILGVIAFGLSQFDIISANAFSNNGHQIGSAIEVVLFSLGLARKLKTVQDENLRVKAETASTLQQRVHDRTEALAIKTLEAQEATIEAVRARELSDSMRMEALEAKEQAENLREQAEKQANTLSELSRQKTAFFQNVSHELRTPLTLILNPLDAESREQPDNLNLSMAVKNSRRLLRLVNQLLDFQKLEAGKKELKLIPVDLSQFALICGEYFNQACLEKQIKFGAFHNGETLNAKALPIHVMGEVDALEKVVFNFLSNALKFTPRGGAIKFGLRTHGGLARIYVQDTGPGISEGGQEKLFQVFSQVDDPAPGGYAGTGLGLALTKSLATQMGGAVGLESELGEGSTFWAEFPICESVRELSDVLIVEPDSTVCASMAATLSQGGGVQSIETVQSTQAANDLLLEHDFRCVVCDAGVGDGIGVDFLCEIARTRPDTRRVLLIAEDAPGVIERAVNEAWVHQIFLKPFAPGRLVTTVSRLVGESPLRVALNEENPFEVKDWELTDALHHGSGIDDELFLAEPQEDNPDSGELILVVDDLPDMRDVIARDLKSRNYRVVSAANGRRALQIAEQYKPDLIITDWIMPEMSGSELIEFLKGDEELSSIPVVLLTAKSDEESKLIGTELGASAFLGKPFNSQELASTVRNLLLLKSREREVERLNRQLRENVLNRYLPPHLVDQIVRGNFEFAVEPRERLVTVLFSDLCGFTRVGEQLSTEDYAGQLNEYLAFMNEIIFNNYGTVDKFMGDAIMVLFGAPQYMAPFDQARRATACAKAMQGGLGLLNQKWAKRGLPSLKARVGIHQGNVVVGNFGSDRRSDYTCIGSGVNLASRIEGVCEPGDVLVSSTIAAHFPDEVTMVGDFELKGIDAKSALYQLI